MLRSLVAAALLVCAWPVHAAGLPDVVFLLLDTTRADRLGAFGNPRRPTPALDGLARDGALFARHFANAHATRASMPQLMTGRYYHQNILARFRSGSHPREFPFARPDPHALLLPAVLRAHGYCTVGVSAHPWVVAESELGRQFDALELVPFPAGAGHGDGAQVVERALALWQARDRTRPLFLYLHFMDAHVPRRAPDGEPRWPVPGYDWRQRFTPDGEPSFDPELRRWSRTDARDFTADDQAWFTAVYDTALAHLDEQVGRLLAGLRRDDPNLQRTLVIAVADHGEELGEDGRTDHTQSLTDTVQHVPWILAGAGVVAGQRSTRITENVDVAPTVLARLGVTAPADGRPQLAPDGRICTACGKSAAYYAWEEYRAVRSGGHLLRLATEDTPDARCQGVALYRMTRPRRTALDPARHPRLLAALRRRLVRRLAAREESFRARRYDVPTESVLLPATFWRVATDGVGCVPIEPTTARGDLHGRGWLWSGHGFFVLDGAGVGPLPVRLDVPAGAYDVDAGVAPIPPAPWLFGFTRWARKTFLRETPATFVPLGRFTSAAPGLALTLPEEIAVRQHVVALRVSPPGVAPRGGAETDDDEQHRRLKALGYVQ